jgi:hypothetical protein
MTDIDLCDLQELDDATDVVVHPLVAYAEVLQSHLKSSQFIYEIAEPTRVNDRLRLPEQVWLLRLEFFQREHLLLQVHPFSQPQFQTNLKQLHLRDPLFYLQAL